MKSRDIYWMEEAINLAKTSDSDWPIAAIIVHDGRMIANQCNKVEAFANPIAHAELLCIENAAKVLGKYLNECTIYCTLEPCAMCMAAIKLSRIGRVIFGAFRRNNNCAYEIDMIGGVLESKCNSILSEFRPNLYDSI